MEAMTAYRVRLVLAAVALAAAVLPQASAKDARLTVEVLSSETNKPVDRASVVVKFRHGLGVNMKKIQTNWETRTGQDGKVKLPSMPQGEISIQIIAKDFQTHGGIYQLSDPEQTITIKVNRPQRQYSEQDQREKDKK